MDSASRFKPMTGDLYNLLVLEGENLSETETHLKQFNGNKEVYISVQIQLTAYA